MAEGKIFKTANKFRADLLLRERAAASEMVRIYGGIWKELDKKIQSLVRSYYSDPQRSTTWLYQYDRLIGLRAQTEEQIRQFANFANARIRAEQLYLVEQAQIHSEQLIRLGLGTPPVGAGFTFNRLAVDALTDLVGFLHDGSPLRDLLNELAGDASQAVADKLVQGLALGLNPRQVARNIRKELGNNLVRALRIARTEQLRAYRESTHRSYNANANVVKGWIWMSARDSRTCASCWAMHGTKHSLDERLDDHTNGRCFSVPVTMTWEEMGFPGIKEFRNEIEDGVTAFGKLTEHQQLAILGPAKYIAFRNGVIKLPDLVGRKRSAKWGTMRYERSLKELGLNSQKFLAEYLKNPVQGAVDIKQAAAEIVALHNAGGGATFSLLYGDMVNKPYFSVSIFPDLSHVVNGKLIDSEAIESFIKPYVGLAKDGKIAIGTWYDIDRGKTFIDFSLLIKDRETAVKLAEKYNQIGIFDLAKMEYIETGGSGDTIPNIPPIYERLKDL